MTAGAAHQAGQREPTESSSAEIPLTVVVSRSDTSVRLRNAIGNAALSGSLPFETVGDYIVAGDGAIPTMLANVRSFGRKTALELDLLVRDAYTGDLEPEPDIQVETTASVQDLTEALGEVSIDAAFAEEVPSVRLAQAMRAGGLGSELLAVCVSDMGAFAARMHRQPNVGRTTVGELRRLAAKVARRRMRAAGLADEAIDDLLRGSERGGGPVEVDEELPDAGDLRACVAWLLSKLRDRDAEVVRLRFGLEGRPQETLEEAGRRYAITRERARQIEARGLRTASALARRLPLEEALRLAWLGEWRRMTGGTGFLDDRTASERIESVDPDVSVAMALRSETSRTWLGRVAHRRSHGWVGAPLSAADVDAAAGGLQRHEHAPLPRPVDAGSECSDKASAAAARAVLGHVIYRDYLIPRRGAARVRRAVDLHSLLVGIGGVVPVERLVGIHLAAEPADGCSVRDALIVMEAAPHLFIEVADDAWFAVGSRARARYIASDAVLPPPTPGDPGDGTIAHALSAALSASGPERLHTLYKDAARILPPGRSANSVGPVLISRPDLFERALPGVYGLVGDLPDPSRLHEEPPPYLLEEQQLRLYALSRRCGEPTDIFPLWGPSAEYALARWGRSSARADSFRSLLAVADISTWPVSADARMAWSDVAAAERRFELSCDCRAADYTLPEPERLLAAAILARHQGQFGWIGINRVCQRRLDATAAAGMLALMVRSGLLTGSEKGIDWQGAYLPGEALDEAICSLSEELGRRGHLDWRSGAAAAVLAAARGPATPGWIDDEAFGRMLGEASTRVPELERLMAEMLDHLLDPEVGSVEPVEERATRMSVERGDEMMSWLLDE